MAVRRVEEKRHATKEIKNSSRFFPFFASRENILADRESCSKARVSSFAPFPPSVIDADQSMHPGCIVIVRRPREGGVGEEDNPGEKNRKHRPQRLACINTAMYSSAEQSGHRASGGGEEAGGCSSAPDRSDIEISRIGLIPSRVNSLRVWPNNHLGERKFVSRFPTNFLIIDPEDLITCRDKQFLR